MNKLFTKIAAVVLGATMATGVGVAVASSADANQVQATSTTVAKTTNELVTEHSWGVSSGSTINGLYTSWALDSNVTISTSGAANCGSVWGTTTKDWRLYQAQSGDITIAVGNGYTLTSVKFTYNISNNGVLATVSGTSVAAGNQIASNSDKTVTGSSVTYYVANTGTKTNGQVRITQFSVTYESTGGASVTGVSVIGTSSKTSYTTVDAWSNAGLTANVTMSDSSTYTGSIVWSYSPDGNPAAAVIANDNEEVTGYSLTATATAGGQSGSKTTTGVSIDYATVAEATAATPATGTLNGVIVKGIVSQIDSIDTTTYYNATYYISDDGTTTGQYEVFRGKNVGNTNFTNSNDLRVGDVVLVYGNLKTYNSTKEFDQGNYLLSLDRPASSDPSITITEASFTMNVGDADVTLHATAENVPTGGSVKWESGSTSVATINESTAVLHAVATGSSAITAKIVDSGDNTVASNSITVTVVANALDDGDTFIIKSNHESTYYYLTGVSSNLGTASTTQSEAMIFTAVEGETTGQFRFKNGSDYLSYSGSSNNLYTTTDDEAASTLWTAIDNDSAIVIESVNVSGRKLQFNYNNGTNPRFACYTSTQTAISIEKVAAPEVDSVTVYGDSTADAEGALSITKEFLYEVTYVDDSGTSAVTVSVLNSSSTTDGASVTTAPSGGTFSVTFTASDTYTVTVTSVEDGTKSDSATIVVSNIYVAVLTDYSLYEGTTVSANAVLTEGDYIFYYSGKAMKASIASSRAEYVEVTPSDDVISTDVQSIIWHVGLDGDYYTLYNALEGKYLASTTTNNQAKLESSVTDNSRWTVEISNGTFEFVNKARDEAGSNNKYLRENTTYGFAVYSSGTGGALSLYKKAYSAVEYSRMFNNYLDAVCDQTAGNTVVADLTATWAIVAAEYSGLDSTVKAELVDACESAAVQAALSSYDYVVGKYNKTQSISAINDFMSRNPDPVGAAKVNPIIASTDSNNTILVIVVVSVISITAIGGYFFLRKRREQN